MDSPFGDSSVHVPETKHTTGLSYTATEPIGCNELLDKNNFIIENKQNIFNKHFTSVAENLISKTFTYYNFTLDC